MRKRSLIPIFSAVALILFFLTSVFAKEVTVGSGSFGKLKAVFPKADKFSYKREFAQGVPHVYFAYSIDKDSGEDVLLGYVLETYDWAPQASGYRGPIKILVGIDSEDRIVGLDIIEHKEDPLSLHEIVDGWFLKQFVGKHKTDALEIGKDIEGVSQATITSRAIARILKDTLTRFGEVKKLAAEGVPSLGQAVVKEEKGEELIKKERKLDDMLKKKKLSLTPARYYKVTK